MRFFGMIVTLACAVVVSSCSSTRGVRSDGFVRHTGVSPSIPGLRVGLAPTLDGGYAGWCVAITATHISRRDHSGAYCGGEKTLTGPIFFETCSGGITLGKTPNVRANVVVLTRGNVVAVTVADRAPVLTESNSALPAGLRAAEIELPGYKIVLKSFVGYTWSPCPRVTPLDGDGKLIDKRGVPSIPLVVRLPTRRWSETGPPRPRGVCQLTVTRLPRETVTYEGTVVARVKAFPQLLGQAFISCAETTYIYDNEHDLHSAVLLNASHPGATPPALPGMEPLAGHPGIFEAPPDRFARRIHGAWLVVQEEDNIGPHVPVELLERLHATIGLY
jgi:hypothetical protein